MKKILSGSIAVAALLALSACSTPTPPAPAETAQATASASASATASVTPSTSAPAVKDGVVEITSPVGQNLPFSSTPVNDGKGEYLPVTILDNDPMLKLNASVVEQTAKDAFTAEEIESANKFAVKFMATEAIDSVLNNNPSDASNTKKWLDTHSELFDPQNKDELTALTLENQPNKPIVFRGQFREGKYELDYGKTATHVASRDVKVKRILAKQIASGQTVIGVQADVNFTLNAKVDGKILPENTSATVGYVLAKNPAGGWYINGFQAGYNTIHVKG